MKVDQGNRNCYNCGGFEHLTRNCRNRRIGDRIGKGRRLEYRENRNKKERRMIEGEDKQNNLNREQDLILLN